MSEQEMQDLLDDLARRGFNDEQLRLDIEKGEAFGLPNFSVTRKREFGEEQMNYRLVIQWQESILGYELGGIEATHRMPVDIDQKYANGFSSHQLDLDMQTVDWPKYWEFKQHGGPKHDSFKNAAGIIDGLSLLLLQEEEEVKLAGEQLMYKHWPPEVFASFSLESQRMRKIFEHNYTFELSRYPDITAELAYLIISERIDAFELQLENMGLDKILPFGFRNELYRDLKHYPAEEFLKLNFSNEKASSILLVPFPIENGWNQVESYELSIKTLPEIKHATINGVNTQRLDKKLATVDWRNDEDVMDLRANPDSTVPRDIKLLQEELFRLAIEPDGKIIADQLMLKYWLNAPYFNEFIPLTALEYLASLPEKSALFSADISIEQAENLLEGRPVMINESELSDVTGSWIRLFFSGNGDYCLGPVDGLSLKELQDLVSILPVHEYLKPEIENGLLNGNEVQTESISGKKLYVKVKESADGIHLFDYKKNEIPFNFHLDPKWEPEQKQVPEQLEVRNQSMKDSRKISVKNSNKKGKGRGL